MIKLDTTWANKKGAFWRSCELEMGQKKAVAVSRSTQQIEIRLRESPIPARESHSALRTEKYAPQTSSYAFTRSGFALTKSVSERARAADGN